MAAARQPTPAAPGRRIEGDLDWIVLRPLSPDARQLVYVRRTADSADLILRNVAEGRDAPLPAPAANEYSPAWSSDGAAVAYLARLWRRLEHHGAGPRERT